jgi:predicted nucleic acid-binding OB-fold protein
MYFFVFFQFFRLTSIIEPYFEEVEDNNMKDLNQLLQKVMEQPEESAIAMFNTANGSSTPEETSATLRALEVLKRADSDLLKEVDNYVERRD